MSPSATGTSRAVRRSCAFTGALSRAKSVRAKSARAKSARAKSARAKSARAESARAKSARAKSARAESARAKSVRAESARAKSARAKSVRAKSARAKSARAKSARAISARAASDCAKSDCAASTRRLTDLTTVQSSSSFRSGFVAEARRKRSPTERTSARCASSAALPSARSFARTSTSPRLSDRISSTPWARCASTERSTIGPTCGGPAAWARSLPTSFSAATICSRISIASAPIRPHPSAHDSSISYSEGVSNRAR